MLVPNHQTQQISFMPSLADKPYTKYHICWRLTSYKTLFIEKQTIYPGYHLCWRQPHMRLIYVDQVSLMLVTNLTSGIKPHGRYLLGWWQIQGCHSISISKFPDFSLTFPWLSTVFQTYLTARMAKCKQGLIILGPGYIKLYSKKNSAN